MGSYAVQAKTKTELRHFRYNAVQKFLLWSNLNHPLPLVWSRGGMSATHNLWSQVGCTSTVKEPSGVCILSHIVVSILLFCTQAMKDSNKLVSSRTCTLDLIMKPRRCNWEICPGGWIRFSYTVDAGGGIPSKCQIRLLERGCHRQRHVIYGERTNTFVCFYVCVTCVWKLLRMKKDANSQMLK